jgi:hypothetical protein
MQIRLNHRGHREHRDGEFRSERRSIVGGCERRFGRYRFSGGSAGRTDLDPGHRQDVRYRPAVLGRAAGGSVGCADFDPSHPTAQPVVLSQMILETLLTP